MQNGTQVLPIAHNSERQYHERLALATLVTLCFIHLFKGHVLCEHNDLHMFSFLFVVTQKWLPLFGGFLSHISLNTHIFKAPIVRHILWLTNDVICHGILFSEVFT